MSLKEKVAQLCPTLCYPMNYTVHGILQARILKWVAFPFSGGSSQPRSPALQVDSLPAEPQGKPKNTGVDSLSLFQGNFPTQESNRDLRHCKWIPYQLSYSGSSYTCPIGIQTTSTCPSFVELIKGNSGLGYYKYLSY